MKNVITPLQVTWFAGSSFDTGDTDGRVHLPGKDHATMCGMEHTAPIETSRKATCDACIAVLNFALSVAAAGLVRSKPVRPRASTHLLHQAVSVDPDTGAYLDTKGRPQSGHR